MEIFANKFSFESMRRSIIILCISIEYICIIFVTITNVIVSSVNVFVIHTLEKKKGKKHHFIGNMSGLMFFN